MERRKKGFTLVEVLVTVGIFIIVILSLLKAFISFSVLEDSADNTAIVLSKAQSKLEEMREHNFDTLMTDYNPGGNPGVFYLTKVNDGVEGAGVIYLRQVSTIPTTLLLEAEVVVCWRNKDGRIVGEDNGGTDSAKALNGVLDTLVGEDTDGNGKMSSRIDLMTMIAKR
jgi:type II secretory pathway pseudopilin PulG